MNKQEAIEKIYETDLYGLSPAESKKAIIPIVSQIDEPQKVVVPKFVAEWYDYAKKQNFSLRQALEHWSMSEELVKWFQYSNNQETFARACLDGCEIEQEQLYTVKIPNNGGFIVLAYINHAMKLVDGNKHLPGKFTKESIEYAGFGWVLDCEGVTVEEVAK